MKASLIVSKILCLAVIAKKVLATIAAMLSISGVSIHLKILSIVK